LEEATTEKDPIAPKKVNRKVVHEHALRMKQLSAEKEKFWERLRSASLTFTELISKNDLPASRSLSGNEFSS
jgi:hypothetical protein